MHNIYRWPKNGGAIRVRFLLGHPVDIHNFSLVPKYQSIRIQCQEGVHDCVYCNTSQVKYGKIFSDPKIVPKIVISVNINILCSGICHQINRKCVVCIIIFHSFIFFLIWYESSYFSDYHGQILGPCPNYVSFRCYLQNKKVVNSHKSGVKTPKDCKVFYGWVPYSFLKSVNQNHLGNSVQDLDHTFWTMGLNVK